MKYTLTFRDINYQYLLDHLFTDRLKERAAYLLCRFSVTDTEIRLLVKEVIPVEEEHVLSSSEVHMSIKSISYVRAMKKARLNNYGLVFVHSHPSGAVGHSKQDKKEEQKLFKTVYQRIPNVPVHASLVISDPEKPVARVWLKDGKIVPISTIRVIGNRFHFYSHNKYKNPYPQFFDRQIRIFGKEIQAALNNMTIGIVGLGGTGSAVAEQLIRLGVGTLYIFDPEKFDTTNINRVYGSRVSDKNKYKTRIIKRLASEIDLGTKIKSYNKGVTYRSAIEKLKHCDVVFGCTDDHWGRSILCQFAIYYYIPVFDVGVKIGSSNGLIKSIQGRTTTILPGEACLLCRGLDSNMIASEALEATDPSNANKRRREGYLPELPGTAPSVVPFTTIVASTAIAEFLHRLTGLFGENRATNEVIQLFDQTRIGKNARSPRGDCFCGNPEFFGKGDVNPLLDMTWRNEN